MSVHYDDDRERALDLPPFLRPPRPTARTGSRARPDSLIGGAGNEGSRQFKSFMQSAIFALSPSTALPSPRVFGVASKA